MTEHLFKIKKDGKTVGYLELKGGIPSPETAAEKPLTAIAGLVWYTAGKTLMALRDIELQWDTAHPFVTKDKNGKDVFAGDEIKALYYWPTPDRKPNVYARNPQPITGKVGWRDETFNWVLYHTPNTPEFAELWKLYDIELIEAKEND